MSVGKDLPTIVGTTESPVPEEAVVNVSAPADGIPPIVTTQSELEQLCKELAAGSGPLAVDTERASGFRYGQEAYLVQLRREGAGTALVDPIHFDDLRPLSDAVDGVEWILHAAGQDLPCLAELRMLPTSIFDTEMAAKLLGRQRVGLGAVLEETLGARLAKEHSAADWSVRPLPTSWLNYAVLDVELLIPLRAALYAELEQAGRLDWALQEFEHIRTRPPKPAKVDPWRNVPRAGRAVKSARSLAVLREVWTAREELAQELDCTPSKVLPHKAVVSAAIAKPKSRRQLSALKEFSSRQARQYSSVWWKAIEQAMKLPESELPPTRVPLPPGELPQARAWERHHPQRAKNLGVVRQCVREYAEELEIPQEVLLAPDTQRHLAWDYHPGTDISAYLMSYEARPWQISQVSDLLERALTAAEKQ